MNQNTFPCGCSPLGNLTKYDYDKTDNIFIGNVSKIIYDRSKNTQKIDFKIIKNYKGLYKTGQTITVQTFRNSSNVCGLDVQKGQQWQIWASGSPSRISSCTRSTRNINENIKELKQYSELLINEKSKKKESRTKTPLLLKQPEQPKTTPCPVCPTSNTIKINVNYFILLIISLFILF
ncbi:unnamed protein product [Didymodactylos carnosus]|uniref:Uncharacterized protein n=1 Tax=Didymodactylos carnosus TaxID=1234261 RepID=A0A815BJ26_9BILA|nr:unnamed protein product [Didymodactylos carnosus]CAF1268184.1 unnamed protein product [Didymodactylos carnosus]CAF3847807.1 unnamed protein product [Didymodactylos carnosus]CAF4053470.1 unnamed protein product [Didymodactylos carnosus]